MNISSHALRSIVFIDFQMSNIYIQEPATRGKVVLDTTVGDIEIVRFFAN